MTTSIKKPKFKVNGKRILNDSYLLEVGRSQNKKGGKKFIELTNGNGNFGGAGGDPGVDFARRMQDRINKEIYSGPVKHISPIGYPFEQLVGEELQRSYCALLAKKYKDRSYRLGAFCATIIARRLLTESECEEILRIVKQVKERLGL